MQPSFQPPTHCLAFLDIRDSANILAAPMPRRRVDVKLYTRMETRTRVIRGMSQAVFLAFALAAGFVVAAMAVPEWRKLKHLRARLQEAEAVEREVMLERDHRQIELRAIREDPSFVEIHARDRLDYCRDGERVLRRRKP